MEPSNMDDELKLIERARRGDEAAFEAVVRRHKNRIYRTCLAMLGDPVEADEAAQDVFVRLYDNFRKFRGESRLSTWLYRVAFNGCADRLRKSRSERMDRTELAGMDPPSSDRPDRWLEEKETAARLRRALDELPEEFREVVILRELEGCDYAEISEILDVPIGTVESRLFRGRQKLKDLLSGGLFGTVVEDVQHG